MSKIVLGPIEAEFIYCPQDSKIRWAVGCKSKNFYLYESNSHPGKYFGTISGIWDWHQNDNDFILIEPGYVKTSLCDLKIDKRNLILYREKGNRFIFKILDENVSDQQLQEIVPSDLQKAAGQELKELKKHPEKYKAYRNIDELLNDALEDEDG